MNIAFVTYDEEPRLTADDRILAEFLTTKNITVTPVQWDDAAVDWKSYDVVILRSMWDYFEKQGKFNSWLDTLASIGCLVLNPVTVVKWNQNKKYLNDLKRKGVLQPPFQYFHKGETCRLPELMRDNGWEKIIAKPAVSCGSFNTHLIRLPPSPSEQAIVTQMLASEDVIIQKFMDEVTAQGEWSLVFFNKRFSHAVLKQPKNHDFRTQAKFGATASPISPSPQTVHQAKSLLDSYEDVLLYARVNGIVGTDGRFHLLEVELVEPVLSFGSHSMACENFYNALRELLVSH